MSQPLPAPASAAAAPSMGGVVAENLACVRGGRMIFESVDFTLAPGDICQIVGSNGAGKSSLLRLLAGLSAPAQGSARVPHPLAFLGHDNGLKRSLSVAVNFALWTQQTGRTIDGDIARALGVPALMNLPVRMLSQGQQRRAALARVLHAQCSLWLLDEPTAGLDAHSSRALADILRRHSARGGIICAAVHGDIGLGKTKLLELA